MDNQPQQRFCTNCGQPLSPGAAFCVSCGSSVNPPSGSPVNAPPKSASNIPDAQTQFQAGAQSMVPPYAQAPMRPEEDPLLLGLAAAEIGRRGRPLRARRPRSRLSGCGCLLFLLLILALLAAPFVGFALTTGKLHTTFLYVAGGMIVFVFLLILIVMLATKSGREALAEAGIEGCLDALFGGFLGG